MFQKQRCFNILCLTDKTLLLSLIIVVTTVFTYFYGNDSILSCNSNRAKFQSLRENQPSLLDKGTVSFRSLNGEESLSILKVKLGAASFFVWNAEIITYITTGRAGESGVTQSFISKLGNPNSLIGQAKGDVLDIGANAGIYGLYAAAMGYNVYLFDLQPMCQRYINAAIAINRFDNLAMVMPYALGRNSKTKIKVSPLTPCQGNLRVSGSTKFEELTANIDRSTFYDISTNRLDDLYFGEYIRLLKIDTEGYEAEVIAGMTRLLQQRKIQTIVVEVTPIFWKEFGMNRREVAEEISGLWDYGFTKVKAWANTDIPNDKDILFLSKNELFTFLNDVDFLQQDLMFDLV